MNNFSRKLIKGSVCLLGLISVGNFLAAPANAGAQAAARGAVTVVRPSGASQSVSGEVLLPTGMYFGGVTSGSSTSSLVVTPVVGTPGTNTETVTSLTVDAGTGKAVSASNNPFLNQAAAKLGVTTTLEETVSTIRAGAGVNGLGGME